MHRPRTTHRLLQIGFLLAVIGLTGASCTPVTTVPPAAQTSPPAVTAAMGVQGVPDGIPVGFTPEGYPYRGSPDAPVTVQEFSDYLCPYCGQYVTQTQPGLLEQYVKTGKARFIFRDDPIASLHPTAPVGHQAALCAAEQGAVPYWKMHDQLFREQDQWRQFTDPAEYLAGAAKAAGADMAAYAACFASGRTVAKVEQGVVEARTLGYNGTPTFRFTRTGSETAYTLEGAQPFDSFTQWIDALLAGEAPPVATLEPTKKAELPFWARPDGLAPDPDRPGYTMAGDPYKGDSRAVMAVVEFGDFQCSSCRKHALEVQPALDKQFVDTGDVLWVFKNLPLKEHPQAQAAAAAAECAGEQGKFWEMHDALFAAVDQWAVDDPDPALAKLAGKLNLDLAHFVACLGSRQALERVMADAYDAQGIISVTPSFVAVYGGTGTIVRGTFPVDEFLNLLRPLLEAAKSSGK